MRHVCSACVALVIAACLGLGIEAQGAIGRRDPAPAGMQKKISIDLKNATPVQALTDLAKEAGVNIVFSRSVAGNCSVTLANVTIEEVFDYILLQNDLAFTLKNNTYYIMSSREYEEQYGMNFRDARAIRVFRLKYAIPERAFAMIENLKSNVGNIVVDEETGTVLVVDTPECIEAMKKTLEVLEQPNEVEVFPLKRAKAKAVEEVMQHWLNEKHLGSIVADENGNQVIVQALPGRMKEVRPLIEKLDKEVVVQAEPTVLGTTARLLAVLLLLLAILVFIAALVRTRRYRAGF